MKTYIPTIHSSSKIADIVQVSVAPTAFVLSFGDVAEANATVRNNGQNVDQFIFSIEGLNPDWYNLSNSSVALFPNDQENLKIFIHPTKSDESTAGSYTFRLVVASKNSPKIKASVELRLDMKVVPELRLEVTPQRIIGRKGTYKIIAVNPGDTTATMQLEAADDDAILHYKLRPARLTVPGGGRSESLMEVKLGWTDFFIGERECDFYVMAILADSGEVKTVSGQLAITPWAPHIPLLPLTQPPSIASFVVDTRDKRKFKLEWLVRQATEVKLDDVDVSQQGEREVSPTRATTYLLSASNKYGKVSQTVNVYPVVVPERKTSDRIRVLMLLTELKANAGGTLIPLAVEVQNMGDIVDKFSVQIEGLEESWYTRSASSLALMPRATGQVQVSFHPPKIKGVQSGTYPFAVAVRSQSRSEECTIVISQLKVLPSVDFTMKVAPIRLSCRRKGCFRVNLVNRGVSSAEIFIEATDSEEGLRLRLKNKKPIVDAWQTTEVQMVAKPKRNSIVGEMKRYDITVTAKSTEGDPQLVHCELHHRPFINSWRPIKALIIIIIIAFVVNYIAGFGGGWSDLFTNPQEWLYEVIRHVRGWLS